MSGFQHILLYSSSEKGAAATFAKTVDLALAHQTKLTIVDVVDVSSSFAQWIFQSPVPAEVRKIAESRARRRLERLAACARDRGVGATAEVLFGKPFVELIRSVVRRNCDLMVKTARGEGGIRERLLGSTALHLMRKCPCPVLVVQPRRYLKFTRILVPIDVRPKDNSASTVNAKIMETALSLAECESSQLHFLHAWRPYGVSLLSSGRTKIPKDQLRQYVRSHEKAHRDRFEEFLSGYSFDHLNHRVHFIQGDAGSLIPELAIRYRVNLVVMGTINNLGFAGSLIGSTAEEVLPQLKCSMLTVKPEGFVTPVNVE
jgi:universal stress protein E